MNDVNQQAVADIKQTLDQKLFDWSREVKIASGWVCKRCGELDREVLESHHIKAKHSFPELVHKLENGECICLWQHALQHLQNPIIHNMILLRLVILLTTRLYRNQKTRCQKELEKQCTKSR